MRLKSQPSVELTDIFTSKLFDNLLTSFENAAILDDKRTSIMGAPVWSSKYFDIDCLDSTLALEKKKEYFSVPAKSNEDSEKSENLTMAKSEIESNYSLRSTRGASQGHNVVSQISKAVNQSDSDPHLLIEPQSYDAINAALSSEQKYSQAVDICISCETKDSDSCCASCSLRNSARKYEQPFRVLVHPQVSLLSDIHAHLSIAEVIGLLAGRWDPLSSTLFVQTSFPCAAITREDGGSTDVELDPSAEIHAREQIASLDLVVVGWYHSHPRFAPNPSVTDIFNQRQYQTLLRDSNTGKEPFVGLIISTYEVKATTIASKHQWFQVVSYPPVSGPATTNAPSAQTIDVGKESDAAAAPSPRQPRSSRTTASGLGASGRRVSQYGRSGPISNIPVNLDVHVCYSAAHVHSGLYLDVNISSDLEARLLNMSTSEEDVQVVPTEPVTVSSGLDDEVGESISDEGPLSRGAASTKRGRGRCRGKGRGRSARQTPSPPHLPPHKLQANISALSKGRKRDATDADGGGRGGGKKLGRPRGSRNGPRPEAVLESDSDADMDPDEEKEEAISRDLGSDGDDREGRRKTSGGDEGEGDAVEAEASPEWEEGKGRGNRSRRGELLRTVEGRASSFPPNVPERSPPSHSTEHTATSADKRKRERTSQDLPTPVPPSTKRTRNGSREEGKVHPSQVHTGEKVFSTSGTEGDVALESPSSSRHQQTQTFSPGELSKDVITHMDVVYVRSSERDVGKSSGRIARSSTPSFPRDEAVSYHVVDEGVRLRERERWLGLCGQLSQMSAPVAISAADHSDAMTLLSISAPSTAPHDPSKHVVTDQEPAEVDPQGGVSGPPTSPPVAGAAVGPVHVPPPPVYGLVAPSCSGHNPPAEGSDHVSSTVGDSVEKEGEMHPIGFRGAGGEVQFCPEGLSTAGEIEEGEGREHEAAEQEGEESEEVVVGDTSGRHLNGEMSTYGYNGGEGNRGDLLVEPPSSYSAAVDGIESRSTEKVEGPLGDRNKSQSETVSRTGRRSSGRSSKRNSLLDEYEVTGVGGRSNRRSGSSSRNDRSGGKNETVGGGDSNDDSDEGSVLGDRERVGKNKADGQSGGQHSVPTPSHHRLVSFLQSRHSASQHARHLLCKVTAPYRGLVISVIGLACYYKGYYRRVDLQARWKGGTKLDKLRASASVWIRYFATRESDLASLEEFLNELLTVFSLWWN